MHIDRHYLKFREFYVFIRNEFVNTADNNCEIRIFYLNGQIECAYNDGLLRINFKYIFTNLHNSFKF